MLYSDILYCSKWQKSYIIEILRAWCYLLTTVLKYVPISQRKINDCLDTYFTLWFQTYTSKIRIPISVVLFSLESSDVLQIIALVLSIAYLNNVFVQIQFSYFSLAWKCLFRFFYFSVWTHSLFVFQIGYLVTNSLYFRGR